MSTPAVTRRAALRRLLALAVSPWAARAWAQVEARPVAPRRVAMADDRCPACGMAVVDARFAAQARSEGGRTLVYDALECLADHLNAHAGPVPAVAAAWLADRVASSAAEAAWLAADDAVLLHHPRLRTPMGGGLAAFADVDAARAFGEAQRLAEPTLLSWGEVLALGVPRPWVPVGR